MWRMSRKQRSKAERLKGWAGSLEGFATPFSPKDVRALQGRIEGEVVLPADAGYAAARQLSNLAFQSFPLLIVYCETFQDVHECLRFAHRHALWVTTRSGGHSTAGFSANDGMVIDTGRLNGVYVDPDRMRAVVGPGTNWGHLNATLADYGLHVPTGICGDVCVAGFMQGGGYGLTSRLFGMNCDNVVEMLVMLADGRIARAAADCNPELFWALRGGTGNNFGILLQVTYELQPLRRLWGYGLRWTLDKAPAGLAALQAGYMASGAPPELGYMAALIREGETPVLVMRGTFWGPRAAGLELLQPLIDETGATLELDRMGSYVELDEWLFTNVPPCPDLAREDKQSTLVARRLKLAEWKRICERFRASPNPWTAVAIEPYGGAINRLARDANAYVHRDSDFDVFVDVFWMNEEQRVEIESYLDDFMALIDPMGNGESYQNYPRRGQADWRERYWAEQFPRLLAIKRLADPDNFFRYAQSISPAPGGRWPEPPPGARIVPVPWSPKPIRKP
ncbi:MAG: FAD-binding oxidoreductase [Burkholderiales bacterium]|nr:FAD-binding oxidoreductase [Burkholderiales bacterium]